MSVGASPDTPTRRLGRCAAAAALVLAAGLGLACEYDSPTELRARTFRIRACEETFRVRIADPAVAREAERLIGRGNVRIVLGTVRPGTGGFNAPWGWHLDPASIDFADVTIELCDGCPSYVESTLPEWLGRTFCPWDTRVIGRD